MKLSAEGKLRLAVRFAFVVGIGAVASDAFAQEGAQAEDPTVAPATGEQSQTSEGASTGKATQLGGVQVTGSRIKSLTLTSNSPVTVINSQELKFEGTTRVEDLINNLPQAFADQGGNISNGSDGTATINLRNLGAQRTLVLLDGKRLPPGTPGNPFADVNFIPAQLVDHVDVLTGGASAVYGADAVAGVVNFVLKRNFEGVRIDYQRSGYLHENDNRYGGISPARGFGTPDHQTFDGGGNELSILFGVNTPDGKGNLTVYGSYLQLDPITQDKRDFSACTFAESGADTFICSGSSTTAPGRFIGDDGISYTIDPTTGNTLIPYVGARDSFNFGPYNYYQRNDERYSFGAQGHYAFNEHADAYTSLGLTDDHTNAVIAPSGAFFGNTYSINCESPLLSADERSKLCAATPTGNTFALIGRRNVEGGGRNADFRRTAYRLVFGVKGDIIQDWSYDASIQYGTTLLSQIYRNDFSNVRLNRALDVVDDGAGNPVCRSVVDGSDPNCVPYNVFTIGGVTPQALTYLQTPGFQNGSTVQQVATGSISGNLGQYGLKSPFADEGIGLAFGGEYRRETSRLENDLEFSTGDLAGQGGATLDAAGGFNVKELFVESKIPLVQHVPLIESLSAELAYRYSDYSQTTATDTYKIQGEWAPTKDFRFRGGFNRAVRAPAIGEFVNPVNVALDGNTDPCAGVFFLPGANGGPDDIVTTVDPNAPNPRGPAAQLAAAQAAAGLSRSQCARDPLIGANPQLFGTLIDNPAQQYNGQTGTDPVGLKSEKADTYTGGIVFSPTFIKNFNLTIDYFSIKVDGTISQIGADTILNSCYVNGALCNLINRNPIAGNSFGSLWLGQAGYVIDFLGNNGGLAVRGVDINLNYRFKLSDAGLSSAAGTLGFDFVGTRDISEKHAPVPGDPSNNYECQGRYGLQCGTPVPLWRHKLRAVYSLPSAFEEGSLTFSAAWRYISSVRADEVSGPNDADDKLADRSYIDLTASVSYKGAYTFRLGVNNVFDKDPPVVGAGSLPAVLGNGNTFPQVYDALGRYLFAGVTLDF